MNFAKLTIVNNRDECVLENGTVVDGMAVGICTGGGETNRVLWASSYTPYPTGVEMQYPVWSRKLRATDAPDNFIVDVSSCG